MKTIQMTTDDRLLNLVDKMNRARKTTRSAFIRDALEAEIRRQQIREEEARHVEGYSRKPIVPGEFDVWSMSRTGAHRESRRRLLVHVQGSRQEAPRTHPDARLSHPRTELGHGRTDHLDDSQHPH